MIEKRDRYRRNEDRNQWEKRERNKEIRRGEKYSHNIKMEISRKKER